MVLAGNNGFSLNAHVVLVFNAGRDLWEKNEPKPPKSKSNPQSRNPHPNPSYTTHPVQHAVVGGGVHVLRSGVVVAALILVNHGAVAAGECAAIGGESAGESSSGPRARVRGE